MEVFERGDFRCHGPLNPLIAPRIMKRLLFPVTAAICVFSMGACVQKQEPKPQKRVGFQQPPQPVPPVEDVTEDTPDKPTPKKDDTGHAGPDATPTQPTGPKNYEYGKPVPGKPGFVTSPHAPAAGYVDVRGFGPATEVKCPYTQTIFLVP